MVTPASHPSRPTLRAAAFAVFLAGTAVYLPSTSHGFAFDDEIVIVKNRYLGTEGGLSSLVSHTEWAGGGITVRAWRPLTALTYAANHAVSALRPWSYHLANALLHGLVSLLLLFLALRFGLAAPAAALSALLFAVHPVHVEAVANVVGRKDVLATLFLGTMLLAHGWAARGGSLRLAAPVAAYAAAMFSKEVGAVGLGLALLWEWLAADSPWRAGGAVRHRATWLHCAYAVALAAYLALYRAVAGGISFGAIPFEDNPAAHASTAARLMTAVAAVGKGLAVQLWPAGQSPDWSYASFPVVTSGADPRFFVTCVLLAAWGAIAIRARASSPVILFALGWYGAALAPAANVLFPVGTIYGERLLYLPSAGLAMALGWAIHRLGQRVPPPFTAASRVAAGLAVAALAVATLRYSAAWRDERHLFEWAARSAPGSVKVHHKLAGALLADGRPDEALSEVDRSLQILPEYGRGWFARAEVLRRLGRRPAAEAALRRAAELRPNDPDVLHALGRQELEAGRLDAAAALWMRTVTASPSHAAALADLSSFHMARGASDSAVYFGERAVAAAPELASAWYNLGILYGARGNASRSRAALERFVATAGPDFAREAEAVRRSLEGK